MELDDVSPALRERLGGEATGGLLALLDKARKEWTHEVIVTAVDRFERRLTDEGATSRVALGHTETKLRTEIGELGAALRTEMAQLASALRVEMADLGSALRSEMADLGSALRADMAALGSALRAEMGGFASKQELREETALLRKEMQEGHQAIRNGISQLGTDLRKEMSDLRFSVVKWNFIFWTGQLLVTAALLGVFLQALRP